MRRFIFLATLLMAFSASAGADDLVSGLSQDQIQITSNYTGSDLLVFGAIERGAASEEDDGGRGDVVVVVRGPDATMSVRRKERVAGIWINTREVTLSGMPGFYYAASSDPLSKIAPPAMLARYEIGFDSVNPGKASTRSIAKTQEARRAVIRERQRAHLYTEAPAGVEFLSYSLFRVHVPVPADAPRGQYTAEVYLFKNGIVTSAQSTPFFVDQIGLERNLFRFARNEGFLYGLATVTMALLLGWLASLIFRTN